MLQLLGTISQKNELDPDVVNNIDDFGDVTCARDNVGMYTYTSAGAKFEENTTCFISNSDSTDTEEVTITWIDSTHIQVKSCAIASGVKTLTDGLLNLASVWIMSPEISLRSNGKNKK